MLEINLKIDSKLTHDIYSKNGTLLLKKGIMLNKHHLMLLRQHNIKFVLEHPNEKENIIKQLYHECYQELLTQYTEVISKPNLTEEDTNKINHVFYRFYSGFVEESLTIIDIKEQFVNNEYIYQHSLNVGVIASEIGRILKLSEEEIYLLALMGLYHDFGKFKVDVEILNKPASLSAIEYEEMKHHTEYGYKLLEKSSLQKEVLLGALLHHERLDGSGYPAGIQGNNIPFLVRILSIADTFDAICSPRVYSKSHSTLFAIDELVIDADRNRLDRQIVLLFCNYLMGLLKERKIPLINGQCAEIVHIHPDYPNQPIIKIDNKIVNFRKMGITLSKLVSS